MKNVYKSEVEPNKKNGHVPVCRRSALAVQLGA